ncbi:MAG: SsrA-binding protein SmpB [Dissulfuribacterales bacterium]
MSKEHSKIVCQNRKARHDYAIEDTLEAGIMLLGPEVKSLREGRGNLTDSYADYREGEIWLYNAHISPYSHATDTSVIDPLRPRKLLLHKKEIRKLIGKIKERGYALIPLAIYFKNGKAKVELALAKGKKQHDKRQAMKEKDLTRELNKQFKVR